MILFTIQNVSQEIGKIYTLPYEIIEHYTPPHSDVAQKCALNGYILDIDDRVVVEGQISEQLPVNLHETWATESEGTWRCGFLWDGSTLTSYPQDSWIGGCSDIIKIT